MWQDLDFHLIHFLYYPFNYPYVWLPVVFWLGAMAGSFLNVCVSRMPKGRSILWPKSHCHRCYQPIRGKDNIPIVSFLTLRGRCRRCGLRFSAGYFGVELFMATAFAGLWLYDVAWNVRAIGSSGERFYMQARGSDLAWVWLYHAVLLFVLTGASLMDWAEARVPHRFLAPALATGIVGASLGPWPWPGPLPPRYVNAADLAWRDLPQGMQLLPPWRPLPSWLPGESPELGLVTSLLGAGAALVALFAANGLLHLTIRSAPVNPSAIHCGAAIGSYLGWQATLIHLLFAAVFLALVFLLRGKRGKQYDRRLPVVAALCCAAALVFLGWPWILSLEAAFRHSL